MNTYADRPIQVVRVAARAEDASDLIVKERRRRASRRESKSSIHQKVFVVKNIIINLFANSNGLWKFVRTERKKSQKPHPENRRDAAPYLTWSAIFFPRWSYVAWMKEKIICHRPCVVFNPRLVL